MGNSSSIPNKTFTTTTNTIYGLYKIPFITSAINVNTENLQKCLNASTSPTQNRVCIQNNISYPSSNSNNSNNQNNQNNSSNMQVVYYGDGITKTENITSVLASSASQTPGKLISQSVENSIKPAPSVPMSFCNENFTTTESDDINIESKKVFCFNSTFTILTVFILILLLIFININSKED